MMAELDILNGFAGKVISDCIDISINAIKKADKNRKSKNQTMETRIYQVTIDALNVFLYNKYKKEEKVYDVAENMLKELKMGNRDYKEAVRFGLSMLSVEITGDICEDFLELLCYEICKEENRDLAVGHIIFQGKIISEQQQQMDQHMQEGFEESHQNEKEILEEVSGVKHLIKEMNGEKGCKMKNKSPIVNRAEEYAQRWDKNVFLNDFNKRDKGARVNIKLRDIYSEEHLPHYKWKTDDESSTDLKELLKEYILDNYNKKMLLILGQAGIGKSTLITWIMANLVKKKENILVYQFATDLDSIDWQSKNVLNDVFSIIGLEYSELENKTLILDGFDEIYTGSDRERILNILNQEFKRIGNLKSFSLIITCRENYIYDLQNIKCNYITLQAWEETQIETFCRAYWEKCGNDILEDKIQKILEKKEIFGVPLILYMILALGITIEKSSSIVDVYDQVFSLEKGVIYDRCYDFEHRINDPEIKEHIYKVSQKMAFWMFENNAEKAFISQEKFEKICEDEISESGKRGEEIQSDILIGNFFKLRHSDGKGTDELQFLHRSIYEYFVATYFFESIHNLTSEEDVAGKLGELLKYGHLSEQILEFTKCKFDRNKGYNLPDMIKGIFQMMVRDGMTYYIKDKYKNVVEREEQIFSNMLEVVLLWNNKLGEFDDKITTYLRYSNFKSFNLKGMVLRNVSLEGAFLPFINLVEADLENVRLMGANLLHANLQKSILSKADLVSVNLAEANLTHANLMKAWLVGADLSKANLMGANLSEAQIIGADFEKANLIDVNLAGANLVGTELVDVKLENPKLEKTIFDEKQIDRLCEQYDLSKSMVYVSETDETISYAEYSIRKYKDNEMEF